MPHGRGTEAAGLNPTLGIDLGGTKIEVSLVDATGRRLVSRRLATAAAEGPAQVAADVAAAAAEVLAEAAEAPGAGSSGVAGVGVGVAGQVDAPRGIVRSAPNLAGWEDFPLAETLSNALDLPVALTNDVNAAALAEQIAGAGRGVDDLVVVFVGTGVGGGVIAGGRLIEGAGGYACELGHMTIVAFGRRCTCGNAGCLEAYCGGWAIAERAREAGLDAPEPIGAAAVAVAAAADDPVARRLIEETGRYLGAGLIGVIHTLNPRRVVLGGGVIEGMPEVAAVARDEVRRHAIPVFREELEIVPPALGSEAGVIGAAFLARERFGGGRAETQAPNRGRRGDGPWTKA